MAQQSGLKRSLTRDVEKAEKFCGGVIG